MSIYLNKSNYLNQASFKPSMKKSGYLKQHSQTSQNLGFGLNPKNFNKKERLLVGASIASFTVMVLSQLAIGIEGERYKKLFSGQTASNQLSTTFKNNSAVLTVKKGEKSFLIQTFKCIPKNIK